MLHGLKGKYFAPEVCFPTPPPTYHKVVNLAQR